MRQALSIIGSSRRNGERQSEDFYPTPAYVVRALLEREMFTGVTGEIACGDGSISRVLKEHGLAVYSSDIVDRGYGEGCIDFLTNHRLQFDNIITNPPYKDALRFILKAKQCTSRKIAMLLKTVFLESEARFEMFNDREFPLKTMYQFSKRVTLYKEGIKMKNSGMIAYAWFVWDKKYTGEPTIKWIKG